MDFRDKIIALRKQQGWSQQDLAGHLGVSCRAVSDWESGASEPEKSCIVRLCTLFGVTADALIRDDLDLDGTAVRIDRGSITVSLQDAYGYVAEKQAAAHKIALGVAACIASVAPIMILEPFNPLADVVGMPLMFLLIAFAVYLFVTSGTALKRYSHIERRKFHTVPGVTEWALDAREQFRPALVRHLAIGIGLCILSPVPVIILDTLFRSDAGVGLLMVMVAAGVYMIVRSCAARNSYQRLLKERDV